MNGLPCYRRIYAAYCTWEQGDPRLSRGLRGFGDFGELGVRGLAMTIGRALPLVLALLVLSFGSANAQFGGMPGMGMPGSPGMGSPGGFSPGFGAQPQQPPAACQSLLVLRDETQKAGNALKVAGEKKAQPDEVCKLFKTFMASEVKMIKGLEDGQQLCGVPPDAIKSVKAQHANVSKMAKQVCDAAAQGPRQTGPSFSEALGSTPPVPDNATKRGYGTFDTLSGSQLAR